MNDLLISDNHRYLGNELFLVDDNKIESLDQYDDRFYVRELVNDGTIEYMVRRNEIYPHLVDKHRRFRDAFIKKRYG